MEDAEWISPENKGPRTNCLKATRNGNGIAMLFVKNIGDKGSIARKGKGKGKVGGSRISSSAKARAS